MADGTNTITNTDASEQQLFDLATPIKTAEGTTAVDVLDELADVLAVAHVFAEHCSKELADDFTIRNAFSSMLYRAHLRAKTASTIAYGVVCDAEWAKKADGTDG